RHNTQADDQHERSEAPHDADGRPDARSEGADTEHSHPYYALVPDQADGRQGRDPRRVGLAALGAACGYSVAFFIPESLLVRVVFGLAVCGLFVGAAFLVPLPKCRRRPSAVLSLTGQWSSRPSP